MGAPSKLLRYAQLKVATVIDITPQIDDGGAFTNMHFFSSLTTFAPGGSVSSSAP